MEEKKEKLVRLIKEENVSALKVMQDELDLSYEETVALLEEVVNEDALRGRISDDGFRFWRTDARVSEAPVVPRDDRLPEFLSYDTRPGKGISIVGCIIDIIALFVLAYATDVGGRDLGAIVFFVGTVVTLSGLYCISRRDSPD
jgi:hypothetical protein